MKLRDDVVREDALRYLGGSGKAPYKRWLWVEVRITRERQPWENWGRAEQKHCRQKEQPVQRPWGNSALGLLERRKGFRVSGAEWAWGLVAWHALVGQAGPDHVGARLTVNKKWQHSHWRDIWIYKMMFLRTFMRDSAAWVFFNCVLIDLSLITRETAYCFLHVLAFWVLL